jgi:hypothetical protein
VLLFLSSVKLVCEIALMALLGLLALLAGDKRDRNFFYQTLKVVTRPFTSAARWIAPRQVADQHVGFVAFFLLTIVWVIVTIEKVRHCVAIGMAECR